MLRLLAFLDAYDLQTRDSLVVEMPLFDSAFEIVLCLASNEQAASMTLKFLSNEDKHSITQVHHLLHCATLLYLPKPDMLLASWCQ